jgi:ACS family hexuronate transporter-like MFS transporter
VYHAIQFLQRGKLTKSGNPSDLLGGCVLVGNKESAVDPREHGDYGSALSRAALIVLVALLLGETTINYIDRQVVSVLAPTIRGEFHLSNAQYAAILNAFLAVYAISYAFAGWALDRLGIGRGLTLAVGWWSLSGMLTALSRGVWSLGTFRGFLAVGEAGAWPAFAKAAATWVPEKARTLVIGICNSGSSLGAMIAPPLVAAITLRWGWRASFVATGALGFVWVIAFQLFRWSHPQMEMTDRQQASASGKVPWRVLLRYRQTWAVFFCRFFADPLWYFFVFWIPEFLTRERGLNLAAIGLVAWIPFLVADVSNFGGGYMSFRLQQAGWSVNRTRKTLMTLAVIFSPMAILAVLSHSLFWTITMISVSIFFWIFWSISVHSLPGDYFPAKAVASVYGIAGTGSTIGSMISTWAVGAVLDATHNYTIVFVGLSMLMPVALIVGFSLMKRVEPIAGMQVE